MRRWWPNRDERVLFVVRLALIAAAFLLALGTNSLDRLVYYLPWLVVLALLASAPRKEMQRPIVATVEASVAVLLATTPVPTAGPLLVYWLAPGLAAGLRGGFVAAGATAAIPLLLGTVSILVSYDADFGPASLLSLAQWSLLALGIGMMAAWMTSRVSAGYDRAQGYADAIRVLTELQDISRRLPTGLDVGTLGQKLLDEVLLVVPSQRSILMTSAGGASFAPIAGIPDMSTHWLPGRERTEAALKDAMTSKVSGTWVGGSRLVVPLAVSGRTFGFLMILEPDIASPGRHQDLVSTVQAGAVPIEAAMLFDDVRDLATMEERNRVAREIHDGIAQDIAFLGYSVDEIVDVTDNEHVRELAVGLREQVTRVVAELRTSVFTLRGRRTGMLTLGGAISAYARRVFPEGDTRLHIVVDETSHRLRPPVEAEVLRIAQEALTNARRHANASNLWVECRVSGSHAVVVVEDDGQGLSGGRADSYGIEIMAERARIIMAELTVENRPGGGTRVRLQL
jgi:signal transduction histidine kinase